jgi:dihydroflavonol-4-reductase
MILVTGGTGHIGNVLVRQLLARGETVRALVREPRRAPALEGLDVELVFGDVLDRDSLARAVRGAQVIYHLAARISLESGPDPETERVNLDGTRNLIAAVQVEAGESGSGRRKGGASPRLVFASSVYALRVPPEGLIDETLPFDPKRARGAYDRSKAAASLEVRKAAAEGLDAVIACPTAAVGPHDFRRSETGRGILYNMPPGLKFYVDGAYDFVDVRDVAQGLIQVAALGRSGQAYILGGERLTVREAAEAVWEAAGGPQWGIRLPDWAADLAAWVFPLLSREPLVTPYSLAAVRSNSHISHDRARRELGYRPRPARQAIIDAVRWWQARRREPTPSPESPEKIAKAAA